jgi:hypothetical protein
MNQEDKKPVNITREELYRQVWATPMSRLGMQYGISGNGLKKICVRLNVPYPPRGYWAKLGGGKSVRQMPLPQPLAGTPIQVVITPTPLPTARGRAPELDPDTAERLCEASVKTSGITVPATLRRPHRTIADWITKREREISDARRDHSRYGVAFQPKPFTSLERRRQRFLSTLLKEAEKLGYKVRGEAPHNLTLEVGRDKVEFTLHERIKQMRRPITPEEKKGYSSNQKWRQDRIPTGELIFALKTYLGPALKREWRDDGDRPIETQIGNIIAVLTVAAPILEKRRLEAEEAQRRRWEEEKRCREERERQDQDRNRWRRFVQFAKQWKDAQLAGSFLAELKRQSVDAEGEYGERPIAEWISWAEQCCDAFDPTHWNVGDIWTDLGAVTARDYPDCR